MRLQDRLKNNLTGNFQTNTSDNLTDIQKRTQNMLLNPEEQVKKAVEQGQIKITDTEKKIFDAAAEVVDTSSQDNNFDVLATPLATPSEAAEAANKYKGIIQLFVLAVVIAGTVAAYLWGKN